MLGLSECLDFGGVSRKPLPTERKMSIDDDYEAVTEVNLPAQVEVPAKFLQDYQHWYAGCLALVEVNMPAREAELTQLHERTNFSGAQRTGIMNYLRSDYISFDSQVAISRCIQQIQVIVNSMPAYLEGRLHDIELAVAQTYIGDQLLEAEALLKAGYVRAAGAVAGVLLERHLKMLCDHHGPPVKYPKTAGISKLNDLLKDAGVYDVAPWRKVQWMGDVRNSCDHANKAEPKKSDVADLISEVRKFVALFVA